MVLFKLIVYLILMIRQLSAISVTVSGNASCSKYGGLPSAKYSDGGYIMLGVALKEDDVGADDLLDEKVFGESETDAGYIASMPYHVSGSASDPSLASGLEPYITFASLCSYDFDAEYYSPIQYLYMLPEHNCREKIVCEIDVDLSENCYTGRNPGEDAPVIGGKVCWCEDGNLDANEYYYDVIGCMCVTFYSIKYGFEIWKKPVCSKELHR